MLILIRWTVDKNNDLMQVNIYMEVELMNLYFII